MLKFEKGFGIQVSGVSNSGYHDVLINPDSVYKKINEKRN